MNSSLLASIRVLLRISLSRILFCSVMFCCSTFLNAFTLNEIYDRVDKLENKVITVRTNVAALRSHSDDIIEQVNDGVTVLAGNVRGMIDEAIVDVQREVDAQLAGRDDFIDNEAIDFRAELLSFIDNVESAINKIGDITDCPAVPEASVDLSVLRDLLN